MIIGKIKLQVIERKGERNKKMSREKKKEIEKSFEEK